MNKLKTKIVYLLVGLLLFVVINVNVDSYALEIPKELNSFNNNSSTITQYELTDDAYIHIESISLESAVDSSCCDSNSTAEDIPLEEQDDLYDNQVTGSISIVDTEEYVAQDELENDNQTLYYVGDATMSGETVFNSTSSDAAKDYYVENWQELEGSLSIMVNKQASCVTVYKGEVPIRAMICSAGETTPEGTYYMDNQWDWLALIEGQYGRYCSQITGDYLFHSVPYDSMDIYDLNTQMYNQLGTLCSHGCIRLKMEDAKWIYDNCKPGTEITIYNDVNPGPMGRPDFQTIPDDQTWDPTDVDVE